MWKSFSEIKKKKFLLLIFNNIVANFYNSPRLQGSDWDTSEAFLKLAAKLKKYFQKIL